MSIKRSKSVSARRDPQFHNSMILGPNLGNGLEDPELNQFTSLNLIKKIFVLICGLIYIKQYFYVVSNVYLFESVFKKPKLT